MSRAMDPAMHAPGFQLAHCLPPAGVGRPKDLDIYRFHRVVPLYTPDPCIGPSQGQLICPPDCGYQKRNDLMPPAGVPRLPDSDSFQFYDTRRDAPKPKPACACPAFANNQPCASLGSITDPLNCPCINRCSYKFQARPWELEDRHPGCLQPQCGLNPRCKQCRQHRAKGHIWNCPGNDPNVGPKMAMFLKCNDDDESLLPPYYFGAC